MYQHHQKKNKRVTAIHDEDGQKILTLISKAGVELQKPDARASDAHSTAKTTIKEQGKSSQSMSHDNFIEIDADLPIVSPRIANRGTAASKHHEVPTPEYIGIYGPIAGPGDRLYANIRVRNFAAEGVQRMSATRCWWNIKEDQKALLDCWTTNTGEAYNLGEFLAPFAQELWDLLEESKTPHSNIYRTTLTASPQIITVLEEILNASKSRLKPKKEHRKLPFWRKIKKVLVNCSLEIAAPFRAPIADIFRAVWSLFQGI